MPLNNPLLDARYRDHDPNFNPFTREIEPTNNQLFSGHEDENTRAWKAIKFEFPRCHPECKVEEMVGDLIWKCRDDTITNKELETLITLNWSYA